MALPRKTELFSTALLMLAALSAGRPAGAQEWTRFRGPNGTGHGKANSIPVKWTEADYNWKVKLPGGGHGSPVLWGDRIFLVSGNDRDGSRIVSCLSAADGSTVWNRTFKSSTFSMNKLNSYGATTPVVDAARLYVAWSSPKSIELRALTHDGKELWHRDLGPHESQHGPCTSPMACGDLIVMPDDQQGDSFLIAMDAATGKTRWKLPRTSGWAAYSTPCVRSLPDGGKELIVTSTANGIAGVNPETGQVNWQDAKACPKRCVSSPVLSGDLVITTSGVGPKGTLVAVRPTAGKKPETVYKFDKNAPYVPSPLIVDGRMYLFGDVGHVSCLNVATGKLLWQERVDEKFFGSPVLAGGRIYCIGRAGKVFVLAGGEEFELLATNPLGELSFATPAVAGGRMYLRTYTHLISLGGKGKG